ncbi:hypothetical protein [Sphingopyxis witflariensis]|uniref:Uncharacterized protein n=1 Tax=Sphingopyxis witflariensis TaxID=173675 RepID=A0A246K4I7_9SPHN|nr:hypothetical protein [Sphingopyxis witflariensis]OWR00920.1 hypothetical protein CDQ91_00290 [Sphingopyxis witflariensis]
MSEADIKGLLMIAVVILLVIGVRALWGKRTPRPSAKNNWRKIDDTKSGRFFDDVGVTSGDPAADGAD